MICCLNENDLCNSRQGSLGCSQVGGITSVLRGPGEKFCMEAAADSTEAVQGRRRVHVRELKGNEKIRDLVCQRGTGDAALETQGTGGQLSRIFLSLFVLGSASS